MPTVQAIALETLLEPGSSTPTSHHDHHSRHSASDPASASPAPKDLHNRPHSTNGATTSLQEHRHHVHVHHHHSSRRRQQQPVFLSRRPREGYNVAGDSTGGRGCAGQAGGSRARSSASGYYISPKLYTTPEPTQIVPTGGISSSPNSVSSPSPYLVNHKRRDVPRPPQPPSPTTTVAAAGNGNGASSFSVVPKSHLNGFDGMSKPPDFEKGNTAGGLSNGSREDCWDGPGEEVVGREAGGREGMRKVGEEEEKSFDFKSNNSGLAENERPDAFVHDDDEDDFFDPRDQMSAVSSSDTEDTSSFRCGGSGRCHTPLTSQSEFYDATEDFLSDGSFSRSSPSSRANMEADLRSIRLNLFEEIERRKKAEEALDHMQNMFQRIARQFSLVGSLPHLPGGNMQYDVDSAAQLCQEVVVMRFVSEALESCLAHVETEAAAEAIVEAKNHEISRLQDRLQYYEAMNQEMSQRNQEAIELARRRRRKRKVRRRWIWGCIGLSVTVSASLMAYYYLMHAGENPSLPSSEHHDPPCGTLVSEGSST